MSYQVGDLALDIVTSSQQALTPINDTIKALNRLSKAISTLNSTQTVFAAQQLTNFFTKLASATQALDKNSLDALASAAKSLSSINKISNLQNVDFNLISNGFNNLTIAITPFIDKVNEAENALTALYGVLSKSGGKKLQNLLNPRKNKGSRGGFLSGLSSIFKLTSISYMGRRLGRTLAEIAKSGADYTETLNLWETSMDANIEKAQKFVDTMNKAYGISDKTLMQAQATFKNMLGALGNISDEVAYTLSEGVTQMALDYASLYNQSFDKAFNKFQAALAGQVRPIRSVAGYDITENTLYQLYQSLGGTKTMRQLNRTEKQLLSLLAIYEQMSSTGALGDLAKTMESYANQTRVTKEMLQEILYYAGALLTNDIQRSGILVKVNGYLIFYADLLKTVANELNAIQHFEKSDPLAGIGENAQASSDAIDELNGKLLDFDKFRSLSGQEEDYITIDDKLLKAFGTLNSYMENMRSEAHEFAKQLKETSGLFNADGTFNYERWERLTTSVKVFGTVVATIFTALIVVFHHLATAITLLISGIGAFIFAWNDMHPVVRAVGIIMSLAAAIAAVGIAWKSLGVGGIAKGLAYAAAISGAILGTVGILTSVAKYKDGGLPDKGTMFIAGEAGAEIVYNNSNGQSGVANIAQIKQAMYQALVEYGQTQKGDNRPLVVYLDGEKVYESTTEHASRHGNKWVKA